MECGFVCAAGLPLVLLVVRLLRGAIYACAAILMGGGCGYRIGVISEAVYVAILFGSFASKVGDGLLQCFWNLIYITGGSYVCGTILLK